MWKTAGPRLTAASLVLAMAAPAALRADETIFCESRNYRYRYCRVDTDHRVSLIRQRSSFAKCELGRSWGYDSRGVWVDRGCSGEFRVGKGGGGNTAAAAGAAALIGALIAGSIVASRNNDKHRDEVPSWAVGTFRGYDSRERTDIEIRVSPSGTVDGFADDNRFSGRWGDGRLDLGKFQFDLKRTNRGFRAVDQRDSGHEIDFTPAGWNQ